MVDEEGYIILIQLLAIKIFDEKQSDLHGSLLRFFITSDELMFHRLHEAIKENQTVEVDGHVVDPIGTTRTLGPL